MRMQNAVDAPPKISSERADAAKNRQRILNAVRKLLSEQAFEDIKMQDIAKAAGVGQGTLYRRFASKGELSEALFAEDLTVFREDVEAYLERGCVKLFWDKHAVTLWQFVGVTAL
jgi:AcrR family transcriptional regulator